MKNTVFSLFVLLIACPAFAATPNTQARRSVTSQMVMAAPRATASTNQISAMAASNGATVDKSSVRVEAEPAPAKTDDTREKEKNACINNNVGVGNTFVWASRYSNINNYAAMIEDIEEPENNVCFVKVSVKSNDPKISVDDIAARYYEMGRDITCGEWVDEEMMRQRILDAKKSTRTWATVGGVVGGAGIGVGAMELFGNKLIGGKVQGQKNENLSDSEVLRSQLLVLKEQKSKDFDDFISALKTLKKECESDIWSGATKPEECEKYDYDYLLSVQ